MLICERPYFSAKVGMFARKNGEYTRPIIASLVDIRIEDCLKDITLYSKSASNYIAKLPDIKEIGQIGKYLIATANLISKVNLTKEEAYKYLRTGLYILLPDSPESPLWEYSKAPWWEYAMCLDEYNGYIKAPKKHRAGEPSPEEIDERLDEFKENKGLIKALSPQTIEKWRQEGKRELFNKSIERI